MLVTILLLTYNGGPRLAETLAAIFRQTLDDLPSPEVLAIDSGSWDDTLATLRQYPQIRLHQIPSAEFGHGRTRNLGARLAQGEWLIYLSQDAVPAHDRWLLNLTRHLRDPQVAAAFSRQLPPAHVGPIETYFLEQTYPPTPRRQRPLPPTPGAPSIQRIFFSNVSAAIKKSVWAQCPFPEDLVMSEDQAFARAALQAGYHLVYDPEAAVYHGHRYTLGQLFRRNFDSGYSLQGLTGDGWGAVVRLGAQYVLGEMRYLWRTGHVAYLPYALLYEITKSAGFALGKSGHRLPAAWRPWFSLHRGYWKSGN